MNLNWADNWLHLGTALVGLVIALVPLGVDRMLGAPRADAGRPALTYVRRLSRAAAQCRRHHR